ncbi:MAG TPA: hypothetical protein VEK08_15990 [Planctomycetota bacterium]|nr:hypothetical protein [Planctomycetota bacterium]
MNDLVEELKSRLRLEEVIARTEPLVRDGRGLRGEARNSLKVDPHKQVWSWWSQDPGQGQKALGGDVLSWIAYNRFKRVQVDGEQFIEVLKEACALAGIAMPEQGDDQARERANERRRREEILERYLQVCESLRDAEFFVRARQIGRKDGGTGGRGDGETCGRGDGEIVDTGGKVYLTREVCERWRLGEAPTLAQCLKAGLTEKELRSVALLRDPLRSGPDERPYMYFRDSLIIPYIEYGRVVYLSSRYFSDYDGRGNKREKKTLHMITPQKGNDWIGMKRPAGFNLEALRDPRAKEVGVLLVEGPLDAIACTERGHPAIAILSGAPSEELCKKLKACA